MRESELWRRLEIVLGPDYVRSWAGSQVMAELGGRTVIEALADGIEAKTVWRACWAVLELPESQR
ncbi:DUF3046 domain-containing protein [Acidipropionibacterium virtanenii]|uniref:DUF3046 domain-containing protein n=1 Tax=Acidipropionibacterium virtanenii TaxID=2057246 RepID=A0A344UUM1_9ACTN|nr:DUF3046 domain-containing protein [Acidipropionibacterium virtanenii]AXE38969.1 hypothetical protein JS278_01810 [Acidipropionibacterium virtanenii]